MTPCSEYFSRHAGMLKIQSLRQGLQQKMQILPPLPASRTYYRDRAAALRAVESPELIKIQRDSAAPAVDMVLKSAGMSLHILLY
jgi:hypothetical protein